MRIIIGMGHPKDVHFWKNTINNLKKDGHEVKIVAWEKDITLYLLNIYGFKYEIIGKSYKELMKKTYGMLKNDFKLLKIVKKFKPDILTHEISLAHVSRLIGKQYIGFFDTEHATITQWLLFPFSDIICTPSCFKKKISAKKHVKYNGYSELAYLHPNYFKPDSSVLDGLGLNKADRFIIIRFVSWGATHDIGQRGFIDKEKLVKELENYGRVFITSEQKLSKNLEKYKITILPEKMHDLLYYATMYIGEGATMASEAAVLGTPAIYVNTQRLGYLDEEEERYGLVFNFSDPKTAQEQAIKKAIELLDDKELKNKWKKKRERLLKEKIDVTAWMTDFIEKFPENFRNQKENKVI